MNINDCGKPLFIVTTNLFCYDWSLYIVMPPTECTLLLLYYCSDNVFVFV